MISKILVPLDGSEYANRALNYAIELAKKFSSEILLVHAVPTATAFITGPEVLDSSLIVGLRKQLEDSGRNILASAEEQTKKAGIKATMKLGYGKPADEILRIAKEENVNLIVMGDRGLGAVGRFFLGSVSDKVSHHSTCPVLLVKL